MKRVVLSIVTFVSFSTAYSQPLTPADLEAKQRAAQAEALVNADPELANPLRGAAPAISFGLSEDKKTAKAQYGVVFDDNSWIIAVSGPVGSDDGSTQLATHRGLNDFVTGEFAYKRTLWQRLPADVVDLTAACKAAIGKSSCVRNTLPESKKAIFDSFLDWAPTWQYGLSAQVGRKAFKFVDAATLADGKESHQASSISASVGVFSSSLYFARLSVDYANSYEAGKKSTICTPVGTAGSRCRDAIVGGPTKKTQHLVQLEAREYFGNGDFAASPRITYETKEKIWSFELPLYVRNTDGPFNGGVNIGWDSKQHEFIFSVFVGALPSLMK